MNGFTKYTILIMTFLSMTISGCYSSGGEENIASEASVSECGGFSSTQAKLISDDDALGALQCGDETLQWQYDTESDQVKLLNSFVWLNCCGEHSIKVIYNEDSDIYFIKETDKPENDGGRCDCMCSFDFSTGFPAFGAEKIKIRLTREVTDADDAPLDIYEGELDLSEESGEISVSRNVGYCK